MPMLPAMNPGDFKLTMEQEFLLIQYHHQITAVSPEDLREAVLELTRQAMIKDNVIKTLVRAAF